MKLTLKRLISLLLTVCLLVSGFGGFGSLTAHAQTLALKDYGHNFLYIEEDRSFQLDLTGRTGAVGAIRWQLTTADSHRTVIEGTAQYPVFTVSTSPEAAALGAAGDIVTLHGDIIAAAMGLTSDLLDAELGVTPTIPPEGIPILLHCTEEGNGTACDEIRLVAEPVEPDTPNPPDNPDQPEDTVYDVFWGTPACDYIFEDQTLFYPLDTANLTDIPDAWLELDIGLCSKNGVYTSLGDGSLTRQYDTETGTQVTGVYINGEKLHNAAKNRLPYNAVNYTFVLIARIYKDGQLLNEAFAEGELRKTYAEYAFYEDETILTNNVPMEFIFEKVYGYYIQSSEHPYGYRQQSNIIRMRQTAGGFSSDVSMQLSSDGTAYILSVAPNYCGIVTLEQIYTDPLTGQLASHKTKLTFTQDLWKIYLTVDEPCFLPGQQRTVSASIAHYTSDPQNGQQIASTDGASLEFHYAAAAYPDVTFVYGNPLTIKANHNAAFDSIGISATLKYEGFLQAREALTLELTDSYYTAVSADLPPVMEVGQSVTIMPELHHYWLDDARNIRSDQVTDGYTIGFWMNDTFQDLTVNNRTVVSSDRFPLGTAFTYTHTAAKSADFFVDFYDQNGSYLNSYYYFTRTKGSFEGVYRIFGQTRYETAFTVADEYKAALGTEQFENIIIASGVNFPDALAGSYLAAVKNAPILMAKVDNGQLLNADELKAYIDANLVPGGQIYVLGGPTAIPTTLEYALSGLSVKRLQGNSRYETNIEILNEAGVTGDTLLVCTGKGYADALSASACGLPILLVDGEGTLKEAQKDFLRQNDFSKIYILGGTQAVNESYDRVLAGYADTVKRLSGANRRATSVLVAETFFASPAAAILAYSDNFPDGLCGGPLAYALGAPILLTKSAASTEAKNYARANGIKAGYVLGGSGLISDSVALDIFNLR